MEVLSCSMPRWSYAVRFSGLRLAYWFAQSSVGLAELEASTTGRRNATAEVRWTRSNALHAKNRKGQKTSAHGTHTRPAAVSPGEVERVQPCASHSGAPSKTPCKLRTPCKVQTHGHPMTPRRVFMAVGRFAWNS